MRTSICLMILFVGFMGACGRVVKQKHHSMLGKNRLLDSILTTRQWKVLPDPSIDEVLFEKQYYQNPERWDSAFAFLAEKDLHTLPVGKYELDGDNLYVNVDEYQTKDYESTRYESHRQYADIQFVVEGEEKISVVSHDKLSSLSPYDPLRDIEFYTGSEDVFHRADSTRFFIFFPTDAHRPCVQVDGKVSVRKVVVKVKLRD